MSWIHQVELIVLFMAFIVSLMQSMETEDDFLYGEEIVTGYDQEKIRRETPKNFIKINLIFLGFWIIGYIFNKVWMFLGGL